jgi:hypothetical protein
VIFQFQIQQFQTMSAVACFKCGKKAFPLEQVRFNNTLVFHKHCTTCTTCGVRLTLTSGKVHETKGLYCQRDWDQQGLGTVGVAGKVGLDDITIAAAKKAEEVRRDATMTNTKEVQGAAAGQQKNTQSSL